MTALVSVCRCFICYQIKIALHLYLSKPAHVCLLYKKKLQQLTVVFVNASAFEHRLNSCTVIPRTVHSCSYLGIGETGAESNGAAGV